MRQESKGTTASTRPAGISHSHYISPFLTNLQRLEPPDFTVPTDPSFSKWHPLSRERSEAYRLCLCHDAIELIGGGRLIREDERRLRGLCLRGLSGANLLSIAEPVSWRGQCLLLCCNVLLDGTVAFMVEYGLLDLRMPRCPSKPFLEVQEIQRMTT